MACVVISPVILHLCHGKSETGFRNGGVGGRGPVEVFQNKIDAKKGNVRSCLMSVSVICLHCALPIWRVNWEELGKREAVHDGN